MQPSVRSTSSTSSSTRRLTAHTPTLLRPSCAARCARDHTRGMLTAAALQPQLHHNHHHGRSPLLSVVPDRCSVVVAAAAAGSSNSAGATSTAAKQEHIVVAPPASNTAPAETECLLVLAPGAGLGPADFRPLAEAVQAAAPGVRLWAACMALDYPALGAVYAQQLLQVPVAAAAAAAGPAAAAPGGSGGGGAKGGAEAYLEQLLAEVRDAAAAAGFKPRMSGWGRCTNLFLCGQSAAGVTFSDVAFKGASGLILLASTIDGRYAKGQLPSLEDYGRPVLILGGELDGQMRWPWQAALAADAAVLAQKAGPCYAAAHQPFILVPGASHAQTSNGVPNFARGDILPAVSDAVATEQLAAAMGAFLSAHQAAGAAARRAAGDELLLSVRRTAELMAPYFMACGMGDVCSAWVTGRQGGPESTASLDAPQDATQHAQHGQHGQHHHAAGQHQQSLLQGARREVAARVSGALHPGVVQKAERFVAAAQLKLASSLPRDVAARLRVVVHTHTEIEALLLNQPRVQEQPDGSVVVAVHALLALPNVVRPGAKLPSCQPAAPEYWLKLKRPQAIADELGLQGTFADGTTASALNSDVLQAALAATPPAAAARYSERGRQLTCGPDVVVPDTSAEQFIRQGAMRWTPQDGPPRGVLVEAPVLTSKSVSEVRAMVASSSSGDAPAPATAMMAAAADDPYMLRFLGNWYTKVLSVAQAMEWVMLDSLRDDVTWS